VQAAKAAASRTAAAHATDDASFAMALHHAAGRPALTSAPVRAAAPLSVVGLEPLPANPADSPGMPPAAATLGVAAPPAGPLCFAAAPWLVDTARFLATPHGADAGRAEADAACSWGASGGGAGESGDAPPAPSRDWAVEWCEAQALGRPADVPPAAAAAAAAGAAPASAPSGGIDGDIDGSDGGAAGGGDTAVLRSRLAAKILSDFVDAATQAAVAALSGLLPPMNPAEDAAQHVWHHGNIFLARVPDTATKRRLFAEAQQAQRAQQAAAALGGDGGGLPPPAPPGAGADVDDAAVLRTALLAAGGSTAASCAEQYADVAVLLNPSQDVRAACALQRADVPGLFAMACVLIDYGGSRLYATSPIPGIIGPAGAESCKLLVGSVDSGGTIAADPALAARMGALARALRLAERVYTPSGAAAAAGAGAGGDGRAGEAAAAEPPGRVFCTAATSSAGTAPVSLVGPVEAKVVRGSDGRCYLMDWVRSTPRDPRYYDPLVAAAKRAWADAAVAAAAGSRSTTNGGGDETTAWAAVVAESPASSAEGPCGGGPSGGGPSGAASRAFASEDDAVADALHATCYEAVLRPELLRTYESYLKLAAVRQHAERRRATAAAAAAASKGTTEGATVTPPGGEVGGDATAAPAAGPATDSSDDAGDSESLLAGFVPPSPPCYNLNAFTRFALLNARQQPGGGGGGESAGDDDERAIRDVAGYLHSHVLPSALRDLLPGSGANGASGVPLDGEALTRLMHARGINVRYLGSLATLACAPLKGGEDSEEDTEQGGGSSSGGSSSSSYARMFPYVLELLEGEMVARVARRMLDARLRECRAAPAVTVAGFLSTLLWAPPPPSAAAEAPSAIDAADPAQAAASTGRASPPPVVVAASKKGGSNSNNKKKANGAGRKAAGVQLPQASPAAGGDVAAPYALVPVSLELRAGAMAAGRAAVDDGDAHHAATAASPLAIPVPLVSFPALLDEGATPADLAGRALEAAGLAAPTAAAAATAPAASAALWRDIAHAVAAKFGGYQLQPGLWAPPAAASGGVAAVPAPATGVNRYALLRRIARRSGLQLAPARLGFSSWPVLAPDDVLGFAPVLAASSMGAGPPAVPHAQEALARGRAALAAGDLPAAYEHTSAGCDGLAGVLGYLHPDVAAGHATLAHVLAAAGHPGSALAHQRRALAVHQRVSGPDGCDTAAAHGAYGRLLCRVGAFDGAVRHLSRAVYLTQLLAPARHPEITAGYATLAQALHQVWHVNGAARCFAEAVGRAGEAGDVGTVTSCLHALALNACLVGGFRDALGYEKRVYALLAERFGADSPPAAQSARWVGLFTQRAVELAKQLREQPLPQLLAPPAAGGAAAAGGGAGGSAGQRGTR
jgi:hypothetical protein